MISLSHACPYRSLNGVEIVSLHIIQVNQYRGIKHPLSFLRQIEEKRYSGLVSPVFLYPCTYVNNFNLYVTFTFENKIQNSAK